MSRWIWLQGCRPLILWWFSTGGPFCLFGCQSCLGLAADLCLARDWRIGRAGYCRSICFTYLLILFLFFLLVLVFPIPLDSQCYYRIDSLNLLPIGLLYFFVPLSLPHLGYFACRVKLIFCWAFVGPSWYYFGITIGFVTWMARWKDTRNWKKITPISFSRIKKLKDNCAEDKRIRGILFGSRKTVMGSWPSALKLKLNRKAYQGLKKPLQEYSQRRHQKRRPERKGPHPQTPAAAGVISPNPTRNLYIDLYGLFPHGLLCQCGPCCFVLVCRNVHVWCVGSRAWGFPRQVFFVFEGAGAPASKTWDGKR